MKKVMNSLPVMILLIALTTCGGGGGGKNGDTPDDEIVLDPSVSAEALANCQTREKLTGLWEQDSVTDGELTFASVKVKFGYYGEFFYRAKEPISDNVLILQGGYSITSFDTIRLKYRSRAKDDDGDVLAEEIVEENAKYALSGDSLTIEFENAPVHQMKRYGSGENSNASGEVTYASIADGDNQFIEDSGGYVFRSDGLCTEGELISEEWNPEGYCIEEEIRGNWYLALPEYHESLVLDAIIFDRTDGGKTRTFEWRYVKFFNFDDSPFAPADSSGGGDVGQIFENPASSENDSDDEDDNLYRYRFSTGTYVFIDESTLELTYERDDLGLYQVSEVERYIVQYNKATDHLLLVSATGKQLVVGRAFNPSVYSTDDETNLIRSDGLCSGTPIVDVCPATNLVGRWELPPFYKELYTGKKIIFGHPYYDYDQDEFVDGLILDLFDWMNFYDNGIARIYRDGVRTGAYYYQVSPCRGCWSGAWTLSLASFRVAFDENYTGPVPRYDIPMIISEKALILRTNVTEELDSYFDDDGRGSPIVMPLMNRPAIVEPMECVEEL